MENRNESEAIQMAKSMLKDGFEMSLMNANEVEDFVWDYLYERKLQSYASIFYVDENGNNSAIIIHEQG